MQNLLINSNIKPENIITSNDYKNLKNINEFLLFSDNILEGITLLNTLTINSELLTFYKIVFEPFDQPIYIFLDEKDRKYAVKVCGSFDKWNLPIDVENIKSYVDIPDYIFYSITNKKPILAGENTETASVGNSQWQREGRKVGSAINKTPFIYQTFYSGKDESSNTIREPNSLQVYTQLLYSARYKTPSFVAYFENNFDGSSTRNRGLDDGLSLFIKYIKSILINDSDPSIFKTKVEIEKQFFNHMINYLKEPKYKAKLNKFSDKSEIEQRLIVDFPSICSNVKEGMLFNTDNFVQDLINHIYDFDDCFEKKYSISEIDNSKLFPWKSYDHKKNISELLSYITKEGQGAKTYIKSNSKIGIAQSNACKNFLISKFPDKKEVIENTIKHEEVVILPLRIHKKSNGQLVFSPDPESGEIVAFSELFAYNLNGSKKRSVIGYCTVDTDDRFIFESKNDTKLYNAISHYIDLMVLNNNQLLYNFKKKEKSVSKYEPENILNTKPHKTNEEVAVVSTYLNQTTINSNWDLCFIHTHHSSWQQIRINGNQEKINRISTKVDLIIQNEDKFMIAEGKNHYQNILSDKKIKQAMQNASETIDRMYNDKSSKFNAFLYNLPTDPSKNPEYYVQRESETVKGGIDLGHFKDIANEKDFVVIIVYVDNQNKTKFELVFSNDFDNLIKEKLISEFYEVHRK